MTGGQMPEEEISLIPCIPSFKDFGLCPCPDQRLNLLHKMWTTVITDMVLELSPVSSNLLMF